MYRLVRLPSPDAEADKAQALVEEALGEFPALTDEPDSDRIVLS